MMFIPTLLAITDPSLRGGFMRILGPIPGITFTTANFSVARSAGAVWTASVGTLGAGFSPPKSDSPARAGARVAAA
jgi:hypothetical protein